MVSVIVPTFNRPEELLRCISAIAACRFDRDQFEIIVVNDGGTVVDVDRLARVAGNMSLQVLTKPNGGPASARNFGAAAARGDFLAFIDDDCAPANDWLECLERALAESPDTLHGGRTLNMLRDNRCSQASQALVDYVYSYYNDPTHYRSCFFASNNMTAPARLFREAGGFDESFRTAEDRDFCRRWRASGREFSYTPEVVVFHGHRLSIRSFQRQHLQYGRGALPYWRKASRTSDARLKVEPISFYLGMLRYPFKQKQTHAGLVALLIFVSQIANAAGFACEWAASFITTLRAPGQQMIRSDADSAQCSSPSVSYHGAAANETS